MMIDMTKKEVRYISLRWIQSLDSMIWEAFHKHSIDDSGTLSKEGYVDDEYDAIEKDIKWLLDKLEKYRI